VVHFSLPWEQQHSQWCPMILTPQTVAWINTRFEGDRLMFVEAHCSQYPIVQTVEHHPHSL
jgi:hypothetical protein